MIFDRAKEDPHGLALDDLSRRRSWIELAERASRLARLLREDLRLKPDDHAALLMGNRVEFVEIALGATLAGVWLTPINRHLQRDEIRYVLEDSGARVVFTDPERAEVCRALSRTAVVTAGTDLDEALSRASSEPMPLDGPAGGCMFYTSGTSGRPKGVKRARGASLGATLEAMETSGRRIGLDGSGPHLVTGPLHHAAPLLFALYDQQNGGPLVIMPRWDETRALALIEERTVRHTHLVPTMLIRLLRLDALVRERFDPSSLTLVLHGAAPIPPSIKHAMIEWWGDVLTEYWGATEGGVCTLVDSADWRAHPGTVGRPIATYEVFAAGADRAPLPPGETGVLYCRHRDLRQVFEYHGAPAKTALAHPEPGLFTTGDVGRVDADGYVYLVDRESNLIISGGVNVYPAEVEQVLQQHRSVADVAVFGIPDDEWGESVKAAVELVAGVRASTELEAEILGFARERLASYKVPRSIDFEDALPRQDNGKLYTRRLRERYWRGRERNI